MANQFENLFQSNHETRGPAERENVPLELKRKAIEAVSVANIMEPLAFQLGAVRMADLILEGEQRGLSRYWPFWLDEEEVAEINKVLFELKNKVHTQHGIEPDPKKARVENKMYELFKNYASQGTDLLGRIEHHYGHWIDTQDIRDILQWVDMQRSKMKYVGAERRELLKAGERFRADIELEKIYKELHEEFLISDLYLEKYAKLGRYKSDGFELATGELFMKTFDKN